MLTTDNLNIIRKGKRAHIYYTVTEIALFMATGGFLQEGNRLLQELWKFKRRHEKDVWLPDVGFTVLWSAAGAAPADVPFELGNIDDIERSMRNYIAIDRWAYEMPALPWTALSGTDLLRKAFITASMFKNRELPVQDNYSNINDFMQDTLQALNLQPEDSFPVAYKELLALEMIERLAEEEVDTDEGYALGAELAARNEQPETAIKLAKQWAKNPKRPALIAAQRHVAPLLLQGVIAEDLGLSSNNVNEYVEQAIEGLSKSPMKRGWFHWAGF
jgi:hypothetical protein